MIEAQGGQANLRRGPNLDVDTKQMPLASPPSLLEHLAQRLVQRPPYAGELLGRAASCEDVGKKQSISVFSHMSETYLNRRTAWHPPFLLTTGFERPGLSPTVNRCRHRSTSALSRSAPGYTGLEAIGRQSGR